MRSGLTCRGVFVCDGAYRHIFTQQKDDAMLSKHCTVHEI